MHISEGLLPPQWAGAWYATSALFLFKGVQQIERRAREVPGYKPLLGMMGAAVFVVSALPIPVPFIGTCSHPAGTGLSALLVGPFPSVVVATVALTIQALFMAHGGLTTLGANILTMGVMGSFAGYAAYRLSRNRLGLGVAAFLAGFFADLATYAGTAVVLGLGIHGNRPVLEVVGKIALAFLPTQLPLALLEGLVTAGMVTYVQKHRPEILFKLGVVAPKIAAGTPKGAAENV